MSGDIIGKIVYFWVFIIGVLFFGKIFGVMNDSKSTIMMLIASSIVYIVWVVGRSKAKQKREDRQWEEAQAKKKKKRGR